MIIGTFFLLLRQIVYIFDIFVFLNYILLAPYIRMFQIVLTETLSHLTFMLFKFRLVMMKKRH